MNPPNEVNLNKEEMGILIFVLKDRLELLDDIKNETELEFDEDDVKERDMIISLLDRFEKAGLKWTKNPNGTYETTLPEGNQLIRVDI